MILLNYRLDHLRKGRNQIVGTFELVLGGEAINYVPALELCRSSNARIVCIMGWLNLISELVFLQTNWLDSFVQDLNQALSTCWSIPLKLDGFSPCSGILMDQKCQKLLLVVTCRDIQTHNSSALLASYFSQGVNRYALTWGELFVSKYHEIYSLRRCWNADWPKMAKVLVLLSYLDIPTDLSRELQIWFPVSKSELTLI